MIHKKTQIFEHTMILLVVASSLIGCSTNQNKIFEQQEYEAKRSNIVFKVQRPDYQIVLDNDNKITQICNVATSSQCNFPKGTGKEVVQISNRQIGLGGYSAITTECGEKNMYAHNNPVERIDSSECSSRFYSISDYHIPVKLIFGVFTLGITILKKSGTSKRGIALMRKFRNGFLRQLRTEKQLAMGLAIPMRKLLRKQGQSWRIWSEQEWHRPLTC